MYPLMSCRNLGSVFWGQRFPLFSKRGQTTALRTTDNEKKPGFRPQPSVWIAASSVHHLFERLAVHAEFAGFAEHLVPFLQMLPQRPR